MGAVKSKPLRTPGRPREHNLAELRQSATTADHLETNTHVYFCAPPGAFCTWTLCPYTMLGKRFGTAEQGLLWAKAEMFGDSKTSAAILKEPNPQKQQRLAANVQQFVEETWHDECLSVMIDVTRCKFSQNDDYREVLLATGSKTLVNAAPHDRLWGIGLTSQQCVKLGEDEKMWQGKNLLGAALMVVRNEVRQGASLSPKGFARLNQAIVGT